MTILYSGEIFYHYTNRSAACSIAREGIIRKGYRGVKLTKMEPNLYFRDEILSNNYGENIDADLRNRADYCVKVHSIKLSKKNLEFIKISDHRIFYSYHGDIRVNEEDVFDKPKCNRTTQGIKYDVNVCQSQHQCQQPSQSYCNKNGNGTKINLNSGLINIGIRSDILLSKYDKEDHQDDKVTVFAFEWVKDGLERIRQKIDKEILLNITDAFGNHIERKLSGDFSMKDLQVVARNESSNTNGEISFGNYVGISEEVIYSLKDLVRQTVIVGKDHTTNYGGFPNNSERVPQEDIVYVCDLIGLQFQHNYNSGRLVIVDENLPKGLLDDLIYEQVVNEKKPTIEQVRNDHSGRFFEWNEVFFDSKAYVKFVANDVVITGLALNQCATEPLNMKFLKYGTGYFAGSFHHLLDKFIGQGVEEGLDTLLKRLPEQHLIKRIELPLFHHNQRIDEICARNNVQLKYSHDDALKKTHENYTTATTNCADPHAMTGNKMSFGSIDGAIAENLRGKAIKFSPVINKLMKEFYFQ